MAIDSPAGVAVVAASPADEKTTYVDWPAIFAGIVLASAISLVLLTFGSAIGLSFVDFRAADDVNPIFIAIVAASWLLWVQVSSFMLGAYLTGRLRKRAHDATEHESDVRDGAHGLLVWAGATIIGVVLVASGLGAAANAVGSAASTAVVAASNAADELNPNAYFADLLYRPAPSATGTTVFNDTTAARDEAGRIFTAAADGDISDADRAYLVQSVSANTGLPQAEAEARVNEVLTNMATARDQALEAAEAARKSAVLAAFLTAASLFVSAAGAWWAATKGGNHRDKQVVFAGFNRF